MVNTSTLLRSGSQENRLNLEANANNIHKDSLDCGITHLGCCNSLRCQKMGNTKTFLSVLIVAGLLQGAIETYFRISAKQVALQYDYNPVVVDWLLVTSGITQGVVALLIAYWGNRIHRSSWFGAIFMLQAVMTLLAIIPTIVFQQVGAADAFTFDELCSEREIEEFSEEQPYIITTLIMLFVVQFAIGLGNVAFYCLGLSYMDDNINEQDSPAFLGAALAARLWGPQLGSGIAFFVEALPLGWWLGWAVLCPFIFTIGLVITLFPRRLLKTAVELAANRILETVSSGTQAFAAQSRFLADISFIASLRRLFTNKLLLFNVVALMLLQTGIYNFMALEESYLQARFFLPTSEADGLYDEWTSRLITFLLTPPLVGLSVLVAGLIIAKVNPSARKLAGWNVITSGIVGLLFVGFIFIKCQNSSIAGGEMGKLTIPHCSNKCICKPNTPFTPICPIESVETYYSPCHAGCSGEELINNVKIYTNCTCAGDTNQIIYDGRATEGACNNSECEKWWIIYQVLNAIAAALLGSGIVGNLLITIRSVLPQDKAIALSLELTSIGLIAFIPGKFLYDFISKSTCQYWDLNQTHCYLHETPRFGNYVDIVTASLIFLSLIFDALVFFFAKYLSLYGEENYDGMFSGVNMVPVQTTRGDGEGDVGGAAEPLLQQPDTAAGVATSTTDTAELRSPPQSPPEIESPPQSLSPPPTDEIRPRSPNRPQTQVLYAEILKTAPTVVAERQARASSASPKHGSPQLNGTRVESPVVDLDSNKSPSPVPLSPLSDRSFTTSDNSSSGASYILPNGPPTVPSQQQPQRPAGFKERLMREPLPDPKAPVTLRAMSPDTPETNF